MFAIDGVKLPSTASKERSGSFAELAHEASRMVRAVKRMLTTHQSRDAADTDEDDVRLNAQRIRHVQNESARIRDFLAVNTERKGAKGHIDNLLGPELPLRLVVAYDDVGQVFGFAAISLTYSLVDPTPEQRRHCQLKELYIRSSQRSRGVGSAIMSWVAQYAAANGCRRLDWPVKATNSRGISFYEGLGA